MSFECWKFQQTVPPPPRRGGWGPSRFSVAGAPRYPTSFSRPACATFEGQMEADIPPQMAYNQNPDWQHYPSMVNPVVQSQEVTGNPSLDYAFVGGLHDGNATAEAPAPMMVFNPILGVVRFSAVALPPVRGTDYAAGFDFSTPYAYNIPSIDPSVVLARYWL